MRSRRFSAKVMVPALVAALMFTPWARAETVDRIVAVVNSEIITLSELNAATAIVMGGLKGKISADASAEDKSRILDRLIEKALMKQSAEKAGIEVSEKEIDNAVEDIKKENSMTQDSLLVALANNGLTYASYREQMREEIRQVKFMDRQFRSGINITDEDVTNYYKQNLKDFYGEPSLRIKVILIANDEHKEERLNAVIEGIKNGIEFSTLAGEYSSSPSAKHGGDIGYVKKDELDPGLREIAEALAPGEISPSIETPNGTYFLQLVEKKEGESAPPDETKKKIKMLLFQKAATEKYEFWLVEMRKFSHIEVKF
ncbi:MAG TPA: peptidyl-prolyl cis-trans isomerase [Thermodesulfobacteriota bacterium]|nr:peptidyl-prolyl cis-trans isomerase [Thermodesulfobacteriota bacterium]